MKRKIKLITCETCGANTEYFAIVDNKKLCAKCEQRTKSKNQRIIELCNQIDQLEQQLDESFTEEDVEGLIEDREKTIKFLQKELTEKDKEIERLNHKINVEEPCLIRNYKDMIEQLKQSQTQLAIKELKKIKDYFILEHEDGLDITKNEFGIAEYLIKKIKELKGE